MDYFEALNEIRAGTIRPAYLFYGREDLLAEDLVERIGSAVLDPVTSMIDRVTFSARVPQAARVLAEAEILPAGPKGRRLILASAEALEDSGRGGGHDPLTVYLRSPNPRTCLVVRFSGDEPPARLRKAFASGGAAVDLKRLPLGKVRRWVEEVARRGGKRIEPGAVDELVRSGEEDLMTLRRELEKAMLHAGDSPVILLSDVREVRSIPPEGDIFSLVDALVAGRPGQALPRLRDLLLAGTAPAQIFAMAVKQLRLLAECLRLRESAGPTMTGKRAAPVAPAELAALLAVHPYVARKAWEQSGGHSLRDLEAALELAYELDADLKKGRVEPHTALELLALGICVPQGRFRRPGRSAG
ncbi:MAG: DNA polymerase III subunit delta [Firmicutes bacterium]|nr:DNA polymerase III subunit delta [Bacillota bacterium]